MSTQNTSPDVPEFPPSDLVCTPAEWQEAYNDGYEAFGLGTLRTSAPEGKAKSPWKAGWASAHTTWTARSSEKLVARKESVQGRQRIYITDALASIAAAQAELKKDVEQHDTVIDSLGQHITQLEQKIAELRNSAIQAEVASGVPTKIVAVNYGLSSARVSQIAPRLAQPNSALGSVPSNPVGATSCE